MAELLCEKNRFEDAIPVLLDIIAIDRNWKEKSAYNKLIDVFATEWSSTITLKIRNEFDQYFMVDCPRSKPNDKKFAKSKQNLKN